MKQSSIIILLTALMSLVSTKAIAVKPWNAEVTEDESDISNTKKNYDFEKDGIYYKIRYSSTTTIFGTSSYISSVSVTYGDVPYSGHITIPEYVFLEQENIENFAFNVSVNPSTQIPVSQIDNKAFYNCTNLQGIDIPRISVIGDSAFACCTGLKEIKFSSWLTCIYAHAFQGCTNLESVYVQESEEVSASLSRSRTRAGLLAVSFPDYGIYDYAFDGCVKLKHIDLSKMPTNGYFYIGKYAFRNCVKLESIEIPDFIHAYQRSMINYRIGSKAFEGCSGLKDIYTNFQLPILEDVFDESTYSNALLHVPEGKTSWYIARTGWNKFKHIVEILPLTPIEEEVDYGGENSKVNENTDLSGTVIDNVYYNISSDNGGFDTDEQCLVVNKAMSNDEIEEVFGKALLSNEVKEKYTGLVIMAPAGKGKVAIDAQTTGGMTLMVKVGAADPIEMELDGKLKMKVPYSVTEPTYVYIYAGQDAASARTRATSEPSLKIYGISLEKDLIKGDANGDGKVNVADIVEVVNYMKGNPSDKFNLDAVSKDGKADISTILEEILDIEATAANDTNDTNPEEGEGTVIYMSPKGEGIYCDGVYPYYSSDAVYFSQELTGLNHSHFRIEFDYTPEAVGTVMVLSSGSRALAININTNNSISIATNNGDHTYLTQSVCKLNSSNHLALTFSDGSLTVNGETFQVVMSTEYDNELLSANYGNGGVYKGTFKNIVVTSY